MTRGIEDAVRFSADGLTLDARLAVPDGAVQGVVICHPHPQYGGTMDNDVVLAIAGALQRIGIATLRFDFRGVGASEGQYGGGSAEVSDVRGAVDCLRNRLGATTISLTGYSFGAMVALRAGCDAANVARLAAVAPPLQMFDVGFLSECPKPKLFVVGDRDQFCPLAEMERRLVAFAEPKALARIRGADHFFFGHDAAVAEAVARFIAEDSPDE